MERTQFTFYESFFKAISRIKKSTDRAAAYDAICAYALYGIEPDIDRMPDAAAIAFELSKPNLDASKRKAISGKAGGKAKQTGSKVEANGKQNASKMEANGKQEQTASEKENKKENKKEKENECYPPTPLEGAGEVLTTALSEWLAYKKERRQSYTPRGLKQLIDKLKCYAAGHGEEAVSKAIYEAMANNWQGIAYEKIERGDYAGVRKPNAVQSTRFDGLDLYAVEG